MPMATVWRSRTRHPRAQAPTWKRYEAWAGAAVFAALFALTATVSPEQPGHYPTCPFRAITGYACPGCGSLRALHDLAHGNFITALTHNAMLVLMLPFAMAVWLRAVTGRTRTVASPWWLGCATMALLAAWTVVRNLPSVRGILTAT
jgi:Protein of unknown function (DUF2752)